MPEIERPVKVVEIDCQCDMCGRGVMRHTDGIALMSHPPQYRHQCTTCGHSQLYHCIYPRSEFRALE